VKQKVNIVIEEGIIQSAKRRAAEEGRPLSDLMQDALVRYMRKKEATTTQERRAAYHLFCERPMRIPPEQLRYVLQEDMWNL